MELRGQIKEIQELQEFSSGFQKQVAIILTEEMYPQPIPVEFTQDKISLLEGVAPGDKVIIGINLRGREWQAPDGEVKYFSSIAAWKLDKLAEDTTPPAKEKKKSSKKEVQPQQPEDVFSEEGEDDDLPF